MSDRMHPIPFDSMLNWVTAEYQDSGSIFGCHKLYRADPERHVSFGGRKIETLVGPAAGPNTQLAQNIVAAYVCGARMFELKTVQIIDGEDLKVSKPCILAEDEGYNCEWSTELTVQQAYEEYIKAWFLLNLLGKELGLGERDGFVFNMSVGYDLAGIKSAKIDDFIEGLKDASRDPFFLRCRQQLLDFLPRCKKMTAQDVEAISPRVCDSITLSTMHGCPAGEIEGIARYLMEEKGLDLYLKCNPTLLGYDGARAALDALGFDYIQFGREQFDTDLGYGDAVAMLRRLTARAKELGRVFGVKLTNTFPVNVLRGELPDAMMYMSGRTLLPLSLAVAAKLSREFDGLLPISYCGGANSQNIASILATGVRPITVCTDLLKPGGYHRLNSMVLNLDRAELAHEGRVDAAALEELAQTLCGRAGRSHEVRRKPKSETAQYRPECRTVCGTCATLCPNRANVVITAGGKRQMLHLDGLCNECGNCASFCPEGSAPYLDKITLFCGEKELSESRNIGFAPVSGSRGEFIVRWNGQVVRFDLNAAGQTLDEDIACVIRAVARAYPYLMYR